MHGVSGVLRRGSHTGVAQVREFSSDRTTNIRFAFAMKARWISQVKLADETGFTVKSLQQIRATEPSVLVTRAKGKATEYKQPDCAVNLRNRARIAGKKEATPRIGNFEEARTRKMEADARLAEIELAQAEGELIPLADYEKSVGEICDRIRGVLMTVPSKYLGRIQVARSDIEAQAVGELIRDQTLVALQGTADEGDDFEDAEAVA